MSVTPGTSSESNLESEVSSDFAEFVENKVQQARQETNTVWWPLKYHQEVAIPNQSAGTRWLLVGMNADKCPDCLVVRQDEVEPSQSQVQRIRLPLLAECNPGVIPPIAPNKYMQQQVGAAILSAHLSGREDGDVIAQEITDLERKELIALVASLVDQPDTQESEDTYVHTPSTKAVAQWLKQIGLIDELSEERKAWEKSAEERVIHETLVQPTIGAMAELGAELMEQLRAHAYRKYGDSWNQGGRITKAVFRPTFILKEVVEGFASLLSCWWERLSKDADGKMRFDACLGAAEAIETAIGVLQAEAETDPQKAAERFCQAVKSAIDGVCIVTAHGQGEINDDIQSIVDTIETCKDAISIEHPAEEANGGTGIEEPGHFAKFTGEWTKTLEANASSSNRGSSFWAWVRQRIPFLTGVGTQNENRLLKIADQVKDVPAKLAETNQKFETEHDQAIHDIAEKHSSEIVEGLDAHLQELSGTTQSPERIESRLLKHFRAFVARQHTLSNEVRKVNSSAWRLHYPFGVQTRDGKRYLSASGARQAVEGEYDDSLRRQTIELMARSVLPILPNGQYLWALRQALQAHGDDLLDALKNNDAESTNLTLAEHILDYVNTATAETQTDDNEPSIVSQLIGGEPLDLSQIDEADAQSLVATLTGEQPPQKTDNPQLQTAVRLLSIAQVSAQAHQSGGQGIVQPPIDLLYYDRLQRYRQLGVSSDDTPEERARQDVEEAVHSLLYNLQIASGVAPENIIHVQQIAKERLLGRYRNQMLNSSGTKCKASEDPHWFPANTKATVTIDDAPVPVIAMAPVLAQGKQSDSDQSKTPMCVVAVQMPDQDEITLERIPTEKVQFTSPQSTS